MFIRAKLLFLCNIIFLLLSINIAAAETITLGVDFDVSVRDGFYVGGWVNEWGPESDYVRHDLGSETSITLDLHEAGSYFFTAQSVVYCSDGSIAKFADGSPAVSAESEIVQYDIDPVVVVSYPSDPPAASNFPVRPVVATVPMGCFLNSIAPNTTAF